MAGRNNKGRAFADLVSIDAWHDDFDGKRKSVDLHTNVVFGRAAFGGEVESEVQFRLSVKNAELILVVPETEPAKVDPRHVERFRKEAIGTLEKTIEKKKQGAVSAGIEFGAGAEGIKAGAHAKGSASAENTITETARISESIAAFQIVQSKNAEGDYRWILSSSDGNSMTGSPWDPDERHLAKIIDKRASGAKTLKPSVRVEVRCRREDLIIEGIELKEKRGFKARVLSRPQDAARIKAAEAYIKNQLKAEGLEAKNLSEDFAQIVLGSVIADALP